MTGFTHPLLHAALATLACIAAATTTTTAHAQTGDTKTARLIAPNPPGGGPERVLRALSQALQQRLGQTVIVDHKPGANGNLAAGEVVRTGREGSAMLLGAETILTVNPHLYRNLGYDKAELVPLALIGSFTQILTCHPSVGAKTLTELIAKAKAAPGKVTYASGGQGSPGHLTMEMLLAASGAQMTHVPYKGPAPAVQDLIGGQVDCGFLVTAIGGEHVKSGRLVGVATSGAKRSASFANLPTIAESGYADFNATFWLTVFAPRAVDAATHKRLEAAVLDAAQASEVRDALQANDTQPEARGTADAVKELDTISRRWAGVITGINLKLD